MANRPHISKHPFYIQVCAVWSTDSIFQSIPFTYRCVQFGQQTAYFKASLLHTGVCGLANNQHISKHLFYRQVCVAFGSFSSTGQRAPTTYLGKHVQVSTVYSRGLVSTCPPKKLSYVSFGGVVGSVQEMSGRAHVEGHTRFTTKRFV